MSNKLTIKGDYKPDEIGDWRCVIVDGESVNHIEMFENSLSEVIRETEFVEKYDHATIRKNNRHHYCLTNGGSMSNNQEYMSMREFQNFRTDVKERFDKVEAKIESIENKQDVQHEDFVKFREESRVDHEQVKGQLTAAEKSRKITHEKMDEVKQDVKQIAELVTKGNSTPVKSQSPILESLKKRAVLIFSIVGTIALTALAIIFLNAIGIDTGSITGVK